MNEKKFKSKYFLRILKQDYHPFTGFKVHIYNNYVEVKQRNWYLISVDTDNIYYTNLAGVQVDKHLIGATLRLKITGSSRDILVYGLSKKRADEIKNLIQSHIL